MKRIAEEPIRTLHVPGRKVGKPFVFKRYGGWRVWCCPEFRNSSQIRFLTHRAAFDAAFYHAYTRHR